MIQLHYLGGSSEITPFGNETVRTHSSEEVAVGPSPCDSDTQPRDTRGCHSPPSCPGSSCGWPEPCPKQPRQPAQHSEAGKMRD